MCSGGAYEMGLMQGHALAKKIHGVRHCLLEMEALRLEKPWWLPFPLFLRLGETRITRGLAPALRQQNPGMFERLEGMAAGAKITLHSLCLMNALEALLASVAGRTVAPPMAACSSVAVRGARSISGQPIIARNFDYLPLVQPYQTLRECRPKQGYRSLQFLVAPQAGAVDGVNEKGLAITLDYAFATDAGVPAPLITMAIADALANCASVTEALHFIAGRPRWGAGMLMLADASGDIASLELTNTRAAHRRPATGEDSLVITNVCQCEATRAVQVPPRDVYGQNVPRSLRGQPVLQCHAERACRIQSLLERQDRVGPDELAAIMADHGPDGILSGSSPCVHADYFRTTACLQWFPADRKVRVAFSNPCVADYAEFGL